MDVKKASPSRLQALKAAMSSGAGQAPQDDDDVMTAPQNLNSGADDTGSPDGDAPPPSPDGGSTDGGDDGMDPVGSISEAQESIQKALGQADDPEDQKSLSEALEYLSKATGILQKHYDQEAKEPESEGADDEEDTSGAGTSEGTDYQGDSK